MTASPSKTKITLAPTESTLLLTLQARYLDSQLPSPILNDTFAGSILDKIDYNFSRLGVGYTTVGICAIRGSLFESWVINFISSHPNGATVLNIACGLDTRAQRLLSHYAGKKVRWFDVDLPDVVKLRKELVPAPSPQEGENIDYTLLAGSAFDAKFINSLPNERPTIILMEGLAPYFTVEEVQGLLSTLCGHFKRGEVVFDSVNWFVVATRKVIGYARQTGGLVQLGLEDGKVLETAHSGLKLLEARPVCMEQDVVKLPLVGRFFMWFCSLFKMTRTGCQVLRYEF
ncbi:S-adenosyl-L-methionine-dependent methyltransferase [Podospora fimiseda]|uniref:S-adenosyl-L-methionine-dependent methyltransferase n=1 Tax=Podospora fimiseda TaxID=252190 RepID=A0AAN7BI04_9PEZI|nr:S-adenosyl-L-methionine-dependent methyltransferase [Podospora fimiseda]